MTLGAPGKFGWWLATSGNIKLCFKYSTGKGLKTMAKIDTLEMTKREQANILSILDMLNRARVQATDGRIWLDERETKEIMSRVEAAYKTMFQEEQEWE